VFRQNIDFGHVIKKAPHISPDGVVFSGIDPAIQKKGCEILSGMNIFHSSKSHSPFCWVAGAMPEKTTPSGLI